MALNDMITFYCCLIAITINFSMVDMYRQEVKRYKKVVDKKKGGFVIYRQQSRCREYLLLQQSKKKQIFEAEWQRLWSTPRGTIKYSESTFKAACVGLKDQTGLSTSDIKIIPKFNLTITYGTTIHWNEVTYFIGKINNGDSEIKLSEEHIRYTWLPYSKALDTAEPEEVTRTIILESEKFLSKIDEDAEDALNR